MAVNRLVSLRDASARLKCDPGVLLSLSRRGSLATFRVGGDVLIDAVWVEQMVKSVAVRDRLWAKVRHLEGQSIGVNEAVTEYGVNLTTLHSCISRGYVRVLSGSAVGGRGNKRLLDRADVAYLAELVRVRGRRAGVRLFDSFTTPPHVK